MTKKVSKQLAKVVKELDIETEKKIELARKLANVCTMYNPRFDRERFFEACGLVEIMCGYCRSNFVVSLGNKAMKIVDCPYCYQQMKIIRDKGEIILHPITKGR